MATRLYLSSSGTPGSSPSIHADWAANTGSPTRLPMSTTPSSTAITTISASPAAFQFRYFMRQYVSPPLNGDQSISGAKQLIFGKCLGAVANKCYWSCMLRVMQGDTSTQRGLLRTHFFPLNYFSASTADTQYEDNTTMTTVSALNGDRIVLEIGLANDDSVARLVQYNIGDNAGSDFAHTNGLTTDLNPWLEFNDVTLSFQGGSSPTTVPNQLMMTGCGL